MVSIPEAAVSSTSLLDLPPHLLHMIFAGTAAPLTTCKASAAIAKDVKLTAAWLLANGQQPLLRAAKHRLWGVCQCLLLTWDYEPDSMEFIEGFKRCAGAGQRSLVSHLLSLCCPTTCEEYCAWCAAPELGMMCAAHANQLEVFNMLVNHPSITADRARYCVNDAAARGLVNMLSLLMSSRPDAGDPQESRRSPPMMVAAYVGNIRVMDVLLQHGADVNDTEGSPWSSWDGAGNPLEAAVRGMQPAAIKWLLKRGADAGPALRTAAQRDMVNILQLMVEHGADIKVHGPSALIKAMSAPALKAALCLLKLGTPTDTHAFLQALGLQQASEYEGWLKQCLTGYNSEQSGLLYNAATEHGHHEFGEMLAKAGACGSQTACHIAACSKVQAII